eukprot:CAMPEP_0119277046 /NCGR_PEP_ID=MMETSP1329-20130426/16483_1 /TAXON_ID=114041 /ORGANISM="Genus nov. species nov., Strain RCC1024" /LENGTH=53 /DNA_ID=CAMNT_0007277499 /DNA_START=164 /DNA_END=322 /DNA_ORIENTATION=+
MSTWWERICKDVLKDSAVLWMRYSDAAAVAAYAATHKKAYELLYDLPLALGFG